MLCALRVSLLVLPFAAATLAAQDPATPQTRPEASDYEETSSLVDVRRFIDSCVKLPHGDRLSVSVAGKSHEGRPLLLIRAALPGRSSNHKLRALIIGNVHVGEVDGKEALQVLAREFASGEHEGILRECEVWMLPIYDVDGNEDRDLDRDFVRAAAPETRVLLELFRTLDPHLFMDLQTTSGSDHGYHLTYAPCLSPNHDPGLARISRELLDEATARMKQEHDLAVFDCGNLETRQPDSTRGWFTHDSRPRHGVNYYGLRNRVAFLGEASGSCDFATRIRATRAFVLTVLQIAAERRNNVTGLCQAAGLRPLDKIDRARFGYGSKLAPPEQLDVLIGEGKSERMPVFRGFRARHHRKLPDYWAVQSPSADAIALLRRHGIEFEELTATRRLRAERFAVSKMSRREPPSEGQQELVLEGVWRGARPFDFAAGTLLVSGRQPLAMLAAQLLEPMSDDGMSTWNFFAADTDKYYPVLRAFAGP